MTEEATGTNSSEEERRESPIESLQRLDRLFQAVDFEAARASLLVDPEPASLVERMPEMDEPLRELGAAQLELLDPDVELDFSTYPMGAPTGNYWKGLDGWAAFWREWLEMWEDFVFNAWDFEQVGDHVVREAMITAKGRGSGVPVEWRQTQVWSFRDGKVIGLHPFETRADALRWIEVQGA